MRAQTAAGEPLGKPFAASVQLSPLMASMHWLAAPLSKVPPAGHAK